MSSANLEQEIKKGQDDFIRHLRKIEQEELQIALDESKNKDIYNLCTCFFCTGSALILSYWYAHYNYDFTI